MKVLYIDKLFPFPPNDGRNIRVFNLLTQLSRSHDVTLLCNRTSGAPTIPLPITTILVDFEPKTAGYVKPLLNLFSLRPYHQQHFNTKKLSKSVSECVSSQSFDAVIIDSVYLAGLIPLLHGLPVVINEHNYEPGIMLSRCRAEANPFLKVFFYLQYRKSLRLQRWALRQPNVSFVCVSNMDARQIAQLNQNAVVGLVPNGVDTIRFTYSVPTDFDTVCFLGSLAWAPNVDGIDYFIKKIWPRIKRSKPNLKLLVVGQDPDNIAARYKIPDIKFTGIVDDIIPYLQRTAVFVVPLRFGGGTKLKLLEAMALGRPVVTTSKGAEGIDGIDDGVHAVIKDSPESFSDGVVDLLSNPRKAIAIGAYGRKLVEQRYDWNTIGQSFDLCLKKALSANSITSICVITSSHQPFDTRIFKKECRSLVNNGFRVTLLAPTDTSNEIVEGIIVLGFGHLKSRLFRSFNLVRIFKMSSKLKADLYHIHEPELLILLPLLRLTNPRAKYIYDVHENYSDAIMSEEKYWIPSIMKPAVAWIMNSSEKYLAKKADMVIAAAPDIEVKFANCRVVSIRNYAPMDIIDRIYQGKEKYHRTGRAEIIYTGSLTRTRGILEIVKALQYVDKKYKVKFVVTGHFHDKEYQKQVMEQHGSDSMEFLGFLPSYEAMISRVITASASMICFHSDPNLDNAVERSNKLFEFMGMGLPVIVSNLPEWAALINKYKCGLVVNPNDPGDIARKIEEILADPKEALAMGQRGRQAVLENFSWEIEGKRLVEAYRQLLVEG